MIKRLGKTWDYELSGWRLSPGRRLSMFKLLGKTVTRAVLAARRNWKTESMRTDLVFRPARLSFSSC